MIQLTSPVHSYCHFFTPESLAVTSRRNVFISKSWMNWTPTLSVSPSESESGISLRVAFREILLYRCRGSYRGVSTFLLYVKVWSMKMKYSALTLPQGAQILTLIWERNCSLKDIHLSRNTWVHRYGECGSTSVNPTV